MTRTLEDAIAQNRAALDSMVKGDSGGYLALLSRADDVTWGNPFGPFAKGQDKVRAALAGAAGRMRDGTASPPDPIATYLSDTLAVVVDVEHAQTVRDGEASSNALRVTSVFRLEDDAWMLVHRHADPITTPR
ncbi:YybH family protein [Zavarzinia sp. CC-PAN008]|uniref:YybH family protein n=1 Tax=Zavarzinia sp. CC-PAN008 TaxID=3243332 RepID=UPI003F74344F